MASTMEQFITAYLTIYRDGDEVVDKKELVDYCRKEKLDMKMVDTWLSHFDVDKDNRITLEEFCRGLGLKANEMRIERNHIKAVQSGRVPKIPDGVEIIASTMPLPRQVEVTQLYKDLLPKSGGHEADMRKVANDFKIKLEERYERVWQVVLLTGSYWMNFSHEPLQSIQFKVDKNIILAWRTPNN
uniref:Tegument antigen (I(H)A) n=1 Tax=Schistosoma japonicum TaxID=6182 RepID=C1LDD5_SCHJA|nr:Tegument antigen (I(H)A) [Schistosoma japonicum]